MSAHAPSHAPEAAKPEASPKPEENGLGCGTVAVGAVALLVGSSALCCLGSSGLAVYDATNRAADADALAVPANTGHACGTEQKATLKKAQTYRDAMFQDPAVRAAGAKFSQPHSIRCAIGAETQPNHRKPEQVWLDGESTVYGPDFFVGGSATDACRRAALELVLGTCQGSTRLSCPTVDGNTSLGAPSELPSGAKALYDTANTSCIQAHQ